MLVRNTLQRPQNHFRVQGNGLGRIIERLGLQLCDRTFLLGHLGNCRGTAMDAR